MPGGLPGGGGSMLAAAIVTLALVTDRQGFVFVLQFVYPCKVCFEFNPKKLKTF